MPVEVRDTPAALHHPLSGNARPKGILKNPSFSAASGEAYLPVPEEPHHAASIPLDPEEERELVHQNTLQNAGHRRSSSAAGRASASRRQSSAIDAGSNDDPDKMRLKWDEANLYLAEQESGGRMKITEPKTPFQHGDAMADAMAEEEEDVAIDPRYVSVDEVELKGKKHPRKSRESEIPGLELGEPEDSIAPDEVDNSRIVGSSSLSRESSKEKHVSVSEGNDFTIPEQVGMPTHEEQEKHRQFEEQRKRHYEMVNVKNLLGHPEELDVDEDDDAGSGGQALPDRSINGTR